MSAIGIQRNAIRCHACGDVIESLTVHDTRRCSCGAVEVDGGLFYLRRTWEKGATWDELSVCVHYPSSVAAGLCGDCGERLEEQP